VTAPTVRVLYQDLESALLRAILHLGVPDDRAPLCARLFAETDRDGVRTHGLARFPRFSAMIRNGSIVPTAVPTRTAGFGAIERWDGNRGPGNLNAYAAMDHAIQLARKHGLGAVALANTNHWMRGGSYGWQAATAGLFAICWTNTLPNTPAWGTAQPTIGNNPIILAIPRSFPLHTTVKDPVVLDMATTQFSMGSLAAYAQSGAQLPVPGGYDTAGNLSLDPAAIELAQRPLPIGFWKGSGLSLSLDLFAAMLSGGLATHQLPTDPLRESGLSQFFLAIDPTTFADPSQLSHIAEAILTNLHNAPPLDPAFPPRYPGEETLRQRKQNLAEGVPVDPILWQKLNDLTI
jgi:3-dehydro-L-gulonate 2-dehydrogenase